MSILSIANAALTTTDNIIKVAKDLASFVDKANAEKNEIENIIRLFYSEVQSNNLLLDVFIGTKEYENSYDAIRVIASCLENDIGKAVVYGNLAGKIQNIVEDSEQPLETTKTVVQNEKETESQDSEALKCINLKNFYSAASFCVQRIEVLKALSQIPADKTAYFKKIRLNQRLQSIKHYTVQLKITLEQYLKIETTKVQVPVATKD